MNEHPNISVLKGFNPNDVEGSADVFAENFIWHYFNQQLPDLQGDYVGFDGLKSFFAELANKTDGTFKVNPVSATAIGDEIVVVHSKNTMPYQGQQIEFDAVVVWRIVEGRIAEAWDIPAINTVKALTV